MSQPRRALALSLAGLALASIGLGDFTNDQVPYFRGHETALFAGWEVFSGDMPWLPDDPATSAGHLPRLHAMHTGGSTVWVDGAGNVRFSNPSGGGETFMVEDSISPPTSGFKEVVLQIAYRGDLDLGSLALQYSVDFEAGYVEPHEVTMLFDNGSRRELLVRYETGHLRSWDANFEYVSPIFAFGALFRFSGSAGSIDTILLDARYELGDDTVTACAVPTINSRPWANHTIRAWIDATGSQTLSDDTVLLMAQGLPFNQFGYFLGSKATGHIANPGGSQGDLCLAGNIGRFVNSAGSSGTSGSIQITVDLAAIPTHPPSSVMVGETWYFQAWYRDVNPTPTSNFTNVVGLTFQ